MAAEFGLHQIYKGEFHDVFDQHHEHEEFGPLLQRMHVVDANGESQMDEDQWEAASAYTLVLPCLYPQMLTIVLLCQTSTSASRSRSGDRCRAPPLFLLLLLQRSLTLHSWSWYPRLGLRAALLCSNGWLPPCIHVCSRTDVTLCCSLVRVDYPVTFIACSIPS